MTSGEARFEEVVPGRTRVDVTTNYADPPGGKAAANILSTPRGTYGRISRTSPG